MTNTPDYKVILFNNQTITINPKQRLISVNILECYDIAVFEIGYTYGQKAFVTVDEQTYVKEKYLRAFCEEIGRKYINVLNLRTNIETMSSLQIAQLTGKRHDNVMRDIKDMLEQLNIDVLSFEGIYLDKYKREKPCYNLNEELTLTLTSGYSIPQRNAIIKEWQAYRQGNAPLQSAIKLENQPALPLFHIVNASAIKIAVSTIDKLPIGEERKAILKAQLLSREFGLNEGLMLPDTPHMLSTTEIANKIGLTANAIGRIVNELGIRDNQELCQTRAGIATHNNKQVELYFYMPQVVDMIRKHLKQKGNKNGKAQQTNLL